MNAKRKTVSQQRARTAEAKPKMTLVPQPDESEHAKATDTVCGARAIHKGVHVECDREAMHAGEHDAGGLTWRRRSGEQP
jgi:hypothetical protein